MTEKTYKVGDVVPWPLVPDRTMVRADGRHMCRFGTIGVISGRDRRVWGFNWITNGTPGRPPTATIIFLGLTGDETAADLQRLAEVFEVREALCSMKVADYATEAALEKAIKSAATGPTMGDLINAVTTTAERLHALGWRKGQTAEDAARLLAEHSK